MVSFVGFKLTDVLCVANISEPDVIGDILLIAEGLSRKAPMKSAKVVQAHVLSANIYWHASNQREQEMTRRCSMMETLVEIAIFFGFYPPKRLSSHWMEFRTLDFCVNFYSPLDIYFCGRGSNHLEKWTSESNSHLFRTKEANYYVWTRPAVCECRCVCVSNNKVYRNWRSQNNHEGEEDFLKHKRIHLHLDKECVYTHTHLPQWHTSGRVKGVRNLAAGYFLHSSVNHSSLAPGEERSVGREMNAQSDAKRARGRCWSLHSPTGHQPRTFCTGLFVGK